MPPSGPAFLRVTGSKRTLGDTAVMCEALLPYTEAGKDLGWLEGHPGLFHLEMEAAPRPEPGSSRVPGQGIAYHTPPLSFPLLCHSDLGGLSALFWALHLGKRPMQLCRPAVCGRPAVDQSPGGRP